MRSSCFFLNSISSGRRAIVPSSCRISQSTPAGCRPAIRGEIDRRFGVTRAAQHAAVLGAQRKDVARLHQIFRHRISGRAMVWMVAARSCALMPVVTPFAASTETVKSVRYISRFCATIRCRPS